MEKTIFQRIIYVPFIVIIAQMLYAVKPPHQPPAGPGGAEYRHAEVSMSSYKEDAEQYWIFEPADPTPASAPVIIFNHGWGAINPKVYGAWIDHLVRKGNIVIYPRYQVRFKYPPEKAVKNAINAVQNALLDLAGERKIKPDLTKLAIVGHSAGGIITANMAAAAESSGIPAPKAIMCVQPGKTQNWRGKKRLPLYDLTLIDSQTLMLVVVGDKDKLAGKKDAIKIFTRAEQIPLENKDFIRIVSDRKGFKKLRADHFSPVARNKIYDSKKPFIYSIGSNKHRTINALDYYGYWKLFDSLCDAAFYGTNREYALGNTPEQRFMGLWSDGTPVKELISTDTP